jgi:ribose/xylose/arabinose/galactoside ABC-type transport system permease subunit
MRRLRRAGPILIFVVLYAIVVSGFALLQPQFLTSGNIETILRLMSANSLAALGLTFVIVVRQFDMSFPWVASFGAMTTGFCIAIGVIPLFAVIIGLAAALVVGAANGVASGIFELPDIVVTIATGSMAFGFAYFYSNGVPISDNYLSSGIMLISNARIAGVSMPVLIMLAIYGASWMLLDATRFGRSFYATGEARMSAYLSGIPVRAYVIAAFCLCAVLATLAATMATAGGGKADLRVGVNFLMPAYAAVYLGSALFGRPSVPATLLGTLFMATLIDGFTLLGVPFYYGDAVVSGSLLAAIGLSSKQMQELFGAAAAQLGLDRGRRS